jgi:hypothetical protein
VPPWCQFAEAMVAQISHADRAMFCKNGSDATSTGDRGGARRPRQAQDPRRAPATTTGAAPTSCALPRQRPVPEEPARISSTSNIETTNRAFADAMKAHEGDIAGVFATPFRARRSSRTRCEPERQLCRAPQGGLGHRGRGPARSSMKRAPVFRLARDCGWEQFGVRPDLLPGPAHCRWPADRRAARLRTCAQGGDRDLRHRLASSVLRRANGGGSRNAAPDPRDRLSAAHLRDGPDDP